MVGWDVLGCDLEIVKLRAMPRVQSRDLIDSTTRLAGMG